MSAHWDGAVEVLKDFASQTSKFVDLNQRAKRMSSDAAARSGGGDFNSKGKRKRDQVEAEKSDGKKKGKSSSSKTKGKSGGGDDDEIEDINAADENMASVSSSLHEIQRQLLQQEACMCEGVALVEAVLSTVRLTCLHDGVVAGGGGRSDGGIVVSEVCIFILKEKNEIYFLTLFRLFL